MLQPDSTTPMKDYYDGREQPVLQIRDYPDPPLHLVVSSTPRMAEAESDASIHLALNAQRKERDAAVEANLESAADDLVASMLLDSVLAQRVADVLPADLSVADRAEAGAVAVRLHDPQWQIVSRYRAAEATLLTLRNFLSEHGILLCVKDAELRSVADRIAGLTHTARIRTLAGRDAVSDTTWARARLGILNIQEER